MSELFFISSNQFKSEEVKAILSLHSIQVEGYKYKINEIQSESMDSIVIDKAIKAFDHLRRPLLVEQTGLHIEDFGNLPAGLTQVFWDSLHAEKFCKYFYGKGSVFAETVLAYCDGKKIHTFKGKIKGVIVEEPRGDRNFQWDCVFQPDGYAETFAEMGKEEKNKISMRRLALEDFALFFTRK